METPTSPVMPCKLDLDKVMVSNRSAEVLRQAAAANAGERGARGAPSSQCCARSPSHHHSSSVGLRGLLSAGEGGTGGCPSPAREGQRAHSGHCWGLRRGMLLTGCLLHSPHSGCRRRSTPLTRTVWRQERPAPPQPAESPVSTVWPLSPARQTVPPAGRLAACITAVEHPLWRGGMP